MGSITISTIDIERSIDIAGICRCMGQNATPFFVGWNNAARRKKFLPFRNFFMKAALTAH
ncbi:hypothetical protein [Rhizobium leguminosarum]|uniref:hypothetical protein n=1 Tax=Rhizobium leguminosarum TaxID=384 RepID=UPI001C93F618|nr:hypothetical protein [Rhizobium leguminosarum]MBY5405196.1 hypothetical protein [Rhizobium leguminosarum]